MQVLSNDYSARAAAAVMNRLAKLSARFIGDRGFSIGIDDVTPAALLQVSLALKTSSSCCGLLLNRGADVCLSASLHRCASEPLRDCRLQKCVVIGYSPL